MSYTYTYHIVRYLRDHRPRKLAGMSGLSLADAQAHCGNAMTHGTVGRGGRLRCGMGRCDTHGLVSGERCPHCDDWLDRDWFDGYNPDV